MAAQLAVLSSLVSERSTAAPILIPLDRIIDTRDIASRTVAQGQPDGIVRYDVVIEADAELSFARDAVPLSLLDAVDDALLRRVDAFAHLREGTNVSLWALARDNTLVAVRLQLADGTWLHAARYDGPLAPIGFYDTAGFAMTSDLRARPVALRRITSRFGDRFDAFTGHRARHHGVDYGVPVGTPVVAVGAGRVKHAGRRSASAGNFVVIEHAGGYESRYLHLDSIDDDVAPDALVAAGQVIGMSGNTGRSTGPHLHYELRLAGIPIDPTSSLPMPAFSLGPIARKQHLAFLAQLEAMR